MATRTRGANPSSVGMMEGAFFVSRSDLIHWVNGLLQISITKVEECASGAIYCQLLDACSGQVAMKKVNWMARSEHEYIPNYKVLQAAFDRNRIERHIDVDKLIRGKYQDNLEFLQWMKCYWDRGDWDEYDPIQAREGKPLPNWAKGSAVIGAGNRSNVGRPGREKENVRPRVPASQVDDVKKVTGEKRGGYAAGGAAPAPGRNTKPTPSTSGRSDAEFEELEKMNAAQADEVEEVRELMVTLENERDHYFQKLREVEILCSTLQAQMPPDMTPEKIIEDVQGILYREHDGEEGEEGEAAEATADASES